MMEMFAFEKSVWEILVRGTVAYLAIAVLVRLMPKRQTGSLSPNDLLALVIVGGLGADAIIGEAKTVTEILLMIIVVLLWDYLFNLLEYYFPRVREIAQHSPTLLIHNGNVLKVNLRKEKLTEQELLASLRRQGVVDIAQVKLAVLEVDGQISVVEYK